MPGDIVTELVAVTGYEVVHAEYHEGMEPATAILELEAADDEGPGFAVNAVNPWTRHMINSAIGFSICHMANESGCIWTCRRFGWIVRTAGFTSRLLSSSNGVVDTRTDSNERW